MRATRWQRPVSPTRSISVCKTIEMSMASLIRSCRSRCSKQSASHIGRSISIHSESASNPAVGPPSKPSRSKKRASTPIAARLTLSSTTFFREARCRVPNGLKNAQHLKNYRFRTRASLVRLMPKPCADGTRHFWILGRCFNSSASTSAFAVCGTTTFAIPRSD